MTGFELRSLSGGKLLSIKTPRPPNKKFRKSKSKGAKLSQIGSPPGELAQAYKKHLVESMGGGGQPGRKLKKGNKRWNEIEEKGFGGEMRKLLAERRHLERVKQDVNLRKVGSEGFGKVTLYKTSEFLRKANRLNTKHVER